MKWITQRPQSGRTDNGRPRPTQTPRNTFITLRRVRGVKADMGRRYRLYPTVDQERVLASWGHTCRALWNTALEQRAYLWTQHAAHPAGQRAVQTTDPCSG